MELKVTSTEEIQETVLSWKLNLISKYNFSKAWISWKNVPVGVYNVIENTLNKKLIKKFFTNFLRVLKSQSRYLWDALCML